MKLAKTIKVDSNFMLEFSPVSGATFELGPLQVECGPNNKVSVSAEGKTISFSDTKIHVGLFEDKVVVGKDGEWVGSFYLDTRFEGGEVSVDVVEGRVFHTTYGDSLLIAEAQAPAAAMPWDMIVPFAATVNHFIQVLVPTVDLTNNFFLVIETKNVLGTILDQDNFKIAVSSEGFEVNFNNQIVTLDRPGDYLAVDLNGSELKITDSHSLVAATVQKPSELNSGFATVAHNCRLHYVESSFLGSKIAKKVVTSEEGYLKWPVSITGTVSKPSNFPVEYDKSLTLGFFAGDGVLLPGVNITNNSLEFNDITHPLKRFNSLHVVIESGPELFLNGRHIGTFTEAPKSIGDGTIEVYCVGVDKKDTFAPYCPPPRFNRLDFSTDRNFPSIASRTSPIAQYSPAQMNFPENLMTVRFDAFTRGWGMEGNTTRFVTQQQVRTLNGRFEAAIVRQYSSSNGNVAVIRLVDMAVVLDFTTDRTIMFEYISEGARRSDIRLIDLDNNLGIWLDSPMTTNGIVTLTKKGSTLSYYLNGTLVRKADVGNRVGLGRVATNIDQYGSGNNENQQANSGFKIILKDVFFSS